MTRAKICGLTRPEDAAAAVRLGASYLGVIFAGGPRLVDSAQARSIVEAAGRIPVFGVFGSQGYAQILEVRDATGLAGAQLHGGASPALVDQLTRAGLLVVVVVKLAGSSDLARLTEQTGLGCPLLIEPRVEGKLGGAGVPLPVALAAEARSRLKKHPMWLAGGLTPDNVVEAVRVVRPDVVDVSSGVEQIPGIKDHQRMARFLEVLA
jgi:phosphoribosylanthranilate isomerase